MTFHKFLVNAIVFKKLFSLSLAVHYFYITIRTFLYKNLRLKNAQNSRTCLKQTRGWGKEKKLLCKYYAKSWKYNFVSRLILDNVRQCINIA